MGKEVEFFGGVGVVFFIVIVVGSFSFLFDYVSEYSCCTATGSTASWASTSINCCAGPSRSAATIYARSATSWSSAPVFSSHRGLCFHTSRSSYLFSDAVRPFCFDLGSPPTPPSPPSSFHPSSGNLRRGSGAQILARYHLAEH